MVERLLEMMREVMENDEFFELQANMIKKFYDALVTAGFTEEQALKIVAGQGIGLKT
jgi:hypothetical protein